VLANSSITGCHPSRSSEVKSAPAEWPGLAWPPWYFSNFSIQVRVLLNTPRPVRFFLLSSPSEKEEEEEKTTTTEQYRSPFFGCCCCAQEKFMTANFANPLWPPIRRRGTSAANKLVSSSSSFKIEKKEKRLF
jgi:hypothetical protein